MFGGKKEQAAKESETLAKVVEQPPSELAVTRTMLEVTVSRAVADVFEKSGLAGALTRLEHVLAEGQRDAGQIHYAATKASEALERLEGVHRDHMGVMLDVQRQQQAEAAMRKREEQQAFLRGQGHERNMAWGAARQDAGKCPAMSKDSQRCMLSFKHDGECSFPKDDDLDKNAAEKMAAYDAAKQKHL